MCKLARKSNLFNCFSYGPNEEIRNQPSEEDLRNKEVFERIWSQTGLPLVTNGSSASGNLPASFRFLPGNLLVFFSAAKAPTLCASRMPSAKTNAIAELPTALHLLCGGLDNVWELMPMLFH